MSSDRLAKLYDRIGSLQDTQYFYEDPAMQVLLQFGDFGSACNVYEAGCGTGRVARMLLSQVFAPSCRYLGADLSAKMVTTAHEAIAPWSPRATVVRADVTTYHPDDGPFDRVLSLFVVDLFDPQRIRAFLDRAYGALSDSGLLCIGGLAEGEGGAARLISEVWKRVHDVVPVVVGGCRPGSVIEELDRDRWRIVHVERRCSFGLCSEAAIAAKI